ncbi:MAG TPA: hypothetical protein P5081_13850 [Phycisphaerae bacterium]|nr:hypothetical protein [Phycisphaerae bacterium]HRW53954.1 hypothetical protein [Phycisphaerae bacterium]
MRSTWLLIMLAPLSVGMDCQSSMTGVGNGDMFPSNNNDNGSTSGDSVTLTLRITGPVDGGFARVYGVKNDGPQTHADLDGRVPQSDFHLSLGKAIGTGVIEQSYQFEKGTQIALVAVEGDGFLAPGGPPDPIDSVPMQFVSWEGDNVTADIGPNPATLYFTLDSDRTIEAAFAPMHPVLITCEGGGAHSGVLIDVAVDRYIVPPRPVESSGASVNSLADENVLWGYFRDGAVLTLTVRDYHDNAPAPCDDPSLGPCYVFVTWNGDCLGTGKVCNLIFGQASDAKVILQDQN